MNFLDDWLCDVAYWLSTKFSRNFRSWFLNLIPWLNFRAITSLFGSVSAAIDKAYILACKLVHAYKNLQVRQCTYFFMGFLLQISSILFPLRNIPFTTFTYSIPMISIKNIWYFLIIYIKYILKTFLKRYFFFIEVLIHTQAWTSRS